MYANTCKKIIEAGRFVKAQISCKFSHHNKINQSFKLRRFNRT
ncbi:Uncharacterised protein [Vibrio cholerae]|nr:Uncharacterised protein [Vibrio cholerae]